MARVEVPITVINSSTGLPVNGAAVEIVVRGTGANAPWWPSETGGSASTAAVITDASGRATAWVERGKYNLNVTGTGITPYTEPWDAVPGGDRTIDQNWIADDVLIPGEIKMYAGATAPNGWLLCQGQAVSRVEYARLWTAIGTTHGAGDGTSTFNLPDLRSRMPIGAGSGPGLTARTLGQKSGTETHVHAGNIPNHTHTGTTPDHLHSAGSLYAADHAHGAWTGIASRGHTFVWGTGNTPEPGGMAWTDHVHAVGIGGSGNVGVGGYTGASDRSLTFTTGGPSATAFTVDTRNHMPPFTVVNFIIKT